MTKESITWHFWKARSSLKRGKKREHSKAQLSFAENPEIDFATLTQQ